MILDMNHTAAAAQSDSLNAVALVEPTMGSLMDEQERVGFGSAVARMRELAAEGRLRDAVRAAAVFPFSDGEIAAAEEAGYFEAAGHSVPNGHAPVVEHMAPGSRESLCIRSRYGCTQSPDWGDRRCCGWPLPECQGFRHEGRPGSPLRL